MQTIKKESEKTFSRMFTKKQAQKYYNKLHQDYLSALVREAERKYGYLRFTKEQKEKYQQDLLRQWTKAKQEVLSINLFSEAKEPKAKEIELQIIKAQIKKTKYQQASLSEFATYQEWQMQGYQVQRGQRSAIKKIYLKKNKQLAKMALFHLSQVKPLA